MYALEFAFGDTSVNLTPEERQRIYEEEKVRVAAQTQARAEALQQQMKQQGEMISKSSSQCVMGCAIFVILIFLMILSFSSGHQGDNSTSIPIGPHDGKTQAQVDIDQKNIETMHEAAKQIEEEDNKGK
jgi:hypothetical protein